MGEPLGMRRKRDEVVLGRWGRAIQRERERERDQEG